MRAQLETFVHSLGRTMTGAAERLDQVDNRIERLEQQARSQTELIALTRTEFDKQGRVLAGLEGQMQSLEDAITRIVAAADRSSALMRSTSRGAAATGTPVLPRAR
jgi:phage shock protein A